MIHLVYVSSATKEMSIGDLNSLLEQSRARNKRQNITGMLLYIGGNYIQVLEGDEKDVCEIYNSILDDSRNEGNIIVEEESIKERDFPTWSMGFQSIENSEMEGYSRFLMDNMRPEDIAINQSSVVELLYLFKETNK